MTRLTDLSISEYTDAQRAVYDEIAAGPRGGVAGPLLVWLRNPELAKSAQALGAYCRYGTALEARHSELAILIVGAHWRCRFEWFIHEPLALAAGISSSAVHAIAQQDTPTFDQIADQLIFDFSHELLNVGAVSDETYKASVNELGERAVIDLVGLLGYYGLVAMTINTFRVEPPEEYSPFEVLD